MKKIIQRLLVFFVGLPLLVILVLCLPQKNHLAISIAAFLFSVLGSLEFAEMLGKKDLPVSRAEALLLGGLCPAAMIIQMNFTTGFDLLSAAFIAGAFWLLVSRVFSGPDKLQNSLNHITAGFSVMIYPGLFMIWIIRMAALPHADWIILMFLLTVIANDSSAWAVGMLFGRGNRGLISASPNKSMAGFIGGLFASVLVGVGAVHFVPAAFTSRLLPSPLAGLILGLLSGAAATVGDLAESVMKRSSNIKDSGSIVPGRGGALDSIDSIALAAPVFYGLYRLLFG